jgi:hypothetical protein
VVAVAQAGSNRDHREIWRSRGRRRGRP